jgi:hypothetical protein
MNDFDHKETATMGFRERRKTLIAVMAMTVMMALPGVAQAGGDKTETDADDAAVTEVTTPEHQVTEVLSTLPVLGSGLSVTITRDDTGAISSVGLDPADGSTIIKENDHKVVFLLSDGNTEVVVKARGHSVQTKVKADDTADVTGPGEWSADVFGTGAVTIPYTVSFVGNVPTITIGDVVAPDGVIAEVGEPKTRASEDGDKAWYKVKVRLTTDDDRAKVSFVAKTYVNDEGELRVGLAVTLSTPDRDRDDDRDDDDRRHKGDRDDDGGGDRDRRDNRGDRSDDDDRGGDDDQRDHGRDDDGDDDGGRDDT